MIGCVTSRTYLKGACLKITLSVITINLEIHSVITTSLIPTEPDLSPPSKQPLFLSFPTYSLFFIKQLDALGKCKSNQGTSLLIILQCRLITLNIKSNILTKAFTAFFIWPMLSLWPYTLTWPFLEYSFPKYSHRFPRITSFWSVQSYHFSRESIFEHNKIITYLFLFLS